MGTRVGFFCLLVIVATLASCASARKNRHHKSNQKNKDEDYLQPRNKRAPAKPYVDPEEYVKLDPYAKPDSYAKPDPYAKTDTYVRPDPYAKPDPYVKQDPPYVKPDPYVQPEPYAKPDPYVQPEPYAKPDPWSYVKPEPHAKPDPYVKQDPYAKPDPYAKSYKSHFMPHHPAPAIPALHGAGPSYYTAYKPKYFHTPGYPAYHPLPPAPGWSKPPAYQPYVTNPLSLMPSPGGFKHVLPLMPSPGWSKPFIPLMPTSGWSSPGYVAPSLSSYSPALNYNTVFNSPSYPARRYRPVGQSGSNPAAPAPAPYAAYKSFPQKS